MLEVITYINENDCTTDLEKQLYEVALDYQQLSKARKGLFEHYERAYNEERKKKVNYAIDSEYVESILGNSPISDDYVRQINDEIWNNDTIVDLIHDLIQQHVN
jgi:hypothetical protein|tara:strand:- start:294 stop:605 length:312 start_codon:yes stop_codon:yes gene_type:complete